MKLVTVGERQFSLSEPVYLLPDTLVLSEDKKTAEGYCLFPTTDQTVRDRGDHVNVTHFQYAVWNVVHVMKHYHGVDRPLIRKASLEGFAVVLPDTRVRFVVRISGMRSHGGMLWGSVEAEFFNESNEKVFKLVVDPFVAQPAAGS